MLKQLFSRFAIALLMASPFLTLAPAYVEASTTSVAESLTGNTIDADSLVVESRAKARLSGTADVSRVRVTITASSSDKTLYKSGRLSVRHGAWHVRVGKKLPDGTYTVSLYQDNRGELTLLTTSTLTVGVPATTLKVQPIALLGGGTARAGTTVPISYLQVNNQSDATTTVAGFWIEQDGTAPESAVIGFSSVDDKGNYRMSTGGTEGQTSFIKGKAYVPSGAVIGPHQMKLFTIKAQLSASAGQYAGQTLQLNVSGVDAPASFNASFPIQGTTWVISQ